MAHITASFYCSNVSANSRQDQINLKEEPRNEQEEQEEE